MVTKRIVDVVPPFIKFHLVPRLTPTHYSCGYRADSENADHP